MSVVAKLQVHVARSYAVTQCHLGSCGTEPPAPPPPPLELPPAAGTAPPPELPPAPPASALTPPCPALPGRDGAPPEPACSGGASELPSPAAPAGDICSPAPEGPAGSASSPLALHAPMPAAITTPDHHIRSGSRFPFIYVVLSSSPLDMNAALIRIFRTVYLVTRSGNADSGASHQSRPVDSECGSAPGRPSQSGQTDPAGDGRSAGGHAALRAEGRGR